MKQIRRNMGNSAITEIKREKGIQGKSWNRLHGGYFSNPVVAEPFIEKIKEYADRSRPDLVIDLGGGTGYILSQFLALNPGCKMLLLDLDASDIQLEQARNAGISCIKGSVDSFSRDVIEAGGSKAKCMFIMRSVLHYFGKDGLAPVLRHIRAQTRPGEFFIHQTASFQDQEEANCLNELYRMMGTGKWYPTVKSLCKTLNDEGWQVHEVARALPLPLNSRDLMKRYNINESEVRKIAENIPGKFSVPKETFRAEKNGFHASLHYWIYLCS